MKLLIVVLLVSLLLGGCATIASFPAGGWLVCGDRGIEKRWTKYGVKCNGDILCEKDGVKKWSAYCEPDEKEVKEKQINQLPEDNKDYITCQLCTSMYCGSPKDNSCNKCSEIPNCKNSVQPIWEIKGGL